MFETNSLVDISRPALVECGLAYTEAYKDPSGSEFFLTRDIDGYKAHIDIFFRLTFDKRKLESPRDAADEITRGLQPIYDSVRASPFVKKMEEEIARLTKRVTELVPYETHYRLEYELRQGKAP